MLPPAHIVPIWGNASIFLIENAYIERSLCTQRGENHRKIVHAAGNQTQSQKGKETIAKHMCWKLSTESVMSDVQCPPPPCHTTAWQSKQGNPRKSAAEVKSNTHHYREAAQPMDTAPEKECRTLKLKTMACSSSPTPAVAPSTKGPRKNWAEGGKWSIIQIPSRTLCGDSSRNLLKDSKGISNTIPDPLTGIWMTGSLWWKLVQSPVYQAYRGHKGCVQVSAPSANAGNADMSS